MNFIKRLSLADGLAEALREKIVAGTYREGDKLPTEQELMTMFNVSRSTVREAMRVLANSGWVRVQQGAGTFVNTRNGHHEPLMQRLIRGEDDDLEEVRNLLEQKIVEKAASHRTAGDLEKMRKHLNERARHTREQNLKSCIEADLNFHIALAQACGNAVLADLYGAFALRLKQSFSERFSSVESFETTQPLHEELLRHIDNRDATRAIETILGIIRL
jgi:DNA-binding FadR family transcriptional regulator